MKVLSSDEYVGRAPGSDAEMPLRIYRSCSSSATVRQNIPDDSRGKRVRATRRKPPCCGAYAAETGETWTTFALTDCLLAQKAHFSSR
jgi:hypothetical protein